MASKPAPRANRKSTRGEYIETDTGNKVSRRSRIEGTSHIILGGRVVVQAEACLRGDLVRLPSSTPDSSTSIADTTTTSKTNNASRTSITIGRYTLLSTGCTLHPPSRTIRTGTTTSLTYYPQKIGENVLIGPGAYIAAASIGSNVHIGANAIIENGCVIRDCVKVLEGSVVVAGMVVPSGVVVGGVPARVLGEVGGGWGVWPAGGSGAGEWVEGGELRELIRSIR